MHNKRVAIVGGGLAGLEVAAHLQQYPNIETDIFEPGYQARTAHVGWDMQYHIGDDQTPLVAPTDAWGHVGLPNRLGGRTFCYSATFGEVEQETLKRFWPSTWAGRLPQLYDTVLRDMKRQYPEMLPDQTGRKLTPFAESLGLSAVPQAAITDRAGSRFRAHTMLEQVKGGPNTTIIRQRVARLVPDGMKRWSIVCQEGLSSSETEVVHSGYDACVLAASAIGNLALIAQSLDTAVLSHISDHQLVGAIIGAPNTDTTRLTVSAHHPKLWSGARVDEALRAKLYMCDLPADSGEVYRSVDAGYEISPEPGVLSTITYAPKSKDAISDIAISSPADLFSSERLEGVRQSLRDLAKRISNTDTLHIAEAADYYQALEMLKHSENPIGRVIFYEYPYGSEEHESCTHAIGSEGLSGVTDDLELVSMPRVFTAGPGNFPALGLAGPSLTIIAMARWLGDHLASKLSDEH